MRYRKTATGIAGVIGTGVLLAACSHVQPSLGQYAIVTGHGALSNQQVQDVVSPGDSINQGDGTTVWYFPSNYRNYVTLPNNGDRSNPQAELTGAPKGQVGMSDYTWTFVGFEVNPAITLKQAHFAMATAFLKFCLKYACASTTAQNDTANAGQVRSSDPGWENMLNEVMPRAIDDATQAAITTYGPDLWTNRAQWNGRGNYGDKIAAQLTTELEDLTGSTIPYFCGAGSTTGDCKQLNVTIQNVTPVDSDVVTQYNKQVSAQYAQQAAAARLNAAKALYGPDAYWFMGMLDLVTQCQAKGVTCNIYAGNPPVTAGK